MIHQSLLIEKQNVLHQKINKKIIKKNKKLQETATVLL
jgi:hypothetical protein